MPAENPPVAANPLPAAGTAVLRTLVLCDLVDSTALLEELGDQAAAELMRRHDRLSRALLQRHGGQEIDKTDGFLILFDRPIEAVSFALNYHRALTEFEQVEHVKLRARVGIHVGEVVLWENTAEDVERGAKPIEVEGLAKPTAARLMSLAGAGQTLLSGVAYSLAERAQSEIGPRTAAVRWRLHGAYRFKGVHDPVSVWEVGEFGVAPFRAPLSSDKAQRVLPWWRRSASLALAAVLALVAIAAPLFLSMRTQPAIAFAPRDWVVVTDLRNLTTNAALGSSLDAAFRMGLDQSRYVNVMTELQIRDALGRMKVAGDVVIERDLARDIALREGARAVIVPSVAAVGRTLRLTAELVEPTSNRMVFVEEVEADDLDDVLPATDRLLAQLRNRLGESLPQIERDSAPLAKVTTSDLDALRAFSLAEQKVQLGALEEAIDLLRYAVERDPGFATAYAREGALLYTLQRSAEARASLVKAAAQSDRLTPREQLYVKAQVARFDSPRKGVELWGLYANMYPDHGAGQNNLGIMLYTMFNDFAGAERAFGEVVGQRFPLRNLTMQAMAYAVLAQGKVEAAAKTLSEASKLSPATLYFAQSDVAVAQRDYSAAESFLRSAPRQAPFYETERNMRRVTLLADQGRIQAAHEVAELILGSGAGLAPTSRRRAEAAAIAMSLALDDERALERLRALLQSISTEVADPELRGLHSAEHLLATAILAARAGLTKEASAAARLCDTLGLVEEFPIRRQLSAVVSAEELIRAGRAQAAVSLLRPLINGQELWELRATLARAERAAGDLHSARDDLQWLVDQRARALAEWVELLFGQADRMVQWNLVRLDLAEVQLDLDDAGAARRSLEEFRRYWPDVDLPEVRARLARLEARATPQLAPNPQGRGPAD